LVRRKRIDGRSKTARRARDLFADYAVRLAHEHGVEINDNPSIYALVLKLSELETLCEEKRAAALRGEAVDLANLVRLEGIARRIRKSLDLDGYPI
jgi:hypothetical protein